MGLDRQSRGGAGFHEVHGLCPFSMDPTICKNPRRPPIARPCLPFGLVCKRLGIGPWIGFWFGPEALGGLWGCCIVPDVHGTNITTLQETSGCKPAKIVVNPILG